MGELVLHFFEQLFGFESGRVLTFSVAMNFNLRLSTALKLLVFIRSQHSKNVILCVVEGAFCFKINI